MKKLLFTLLLVCFATYSSAQSKENLTEEEKEELTERAKQKIDDFLMYLSTIASKNITDGSIKDAATTSALELFIGKGHSYYAVDDYGNEYLHKPVTMQTTGRYGRKNKPKPMTKYLADLRQLPYSRVEIESAAAIRVDKIEQVSDGRYKATAYFCQNFIGYRGEVTAYSSWDMKSVTLYIDREYVHSPNGLLSIWKILLGDISAVETAPLQAS